MWTWLGSPLTRNVNKTFFKTKTRPRPQVLSPRPRPRPSRAGLEAPPYQDRDTMTASVPLTTMQYVMYFRFCGRRHVCPQWAIWRVANRAYIQSDSRGGSTEGEVWYLRLPYLHRRLTAVHPLLPRFANIVAPTLFL